ncbi:Box C/D snoRNA protein 1 [Boothiomyces sp. JEL0838]|nr:Box C/D snoRNA protein 1 [Boothiomyces sp. JEL0838]
MSCQIPECENDSKYKCPKCFFRTCSLDCTKKHKVDCSMQREKTNYISKSTMNVNTLTSDYNFLMEVGRINDNAKRFPNEKKKEFMIRLANQRMIDLKLMPVGMHRQKLNKTFYKKGFNWTIEIVFNNQKYYKLTNEETVLLDVLNEMNAELKSNAKYLYLKQKNGLIELDLNQDLNFNLKATEIIEFPTIILSTVELDSIRKDLYSDKQSEIQTECKLERSENQIQAEKSENQIQAEKSENQIQAEKSENQIQAERSVQGELESESSAEDGELSE